MRTTYKTSLATLVLLLHARVSGVAYKWVYISQYSGSLICDIVQSCKWMPKFQRNILYPSSGPKWCVLDPQDVSEKC
jgi:hypothetical protein